MKGQWVGRRERLEKGRGFGGCWGGAGGEDAQQFWKNGGRRRGEERE